MRHSITVIFVTVHWWIEAYQKFGKLTTDSIKKSSAAFDLFTNDLNFQDVRIYTDSSKSQMIEKLDLVQLEANEYSQSRKRQDKLLLVTIVCIGTGLNPDDRD